MDLWILSLFISLSLRPKELACIQLVRAENTALLACFSRSLLKIHTDVYISDVSCIFSPVVAAVMHASSLRDDNHIIRMLTTDRVIYPRNKQDEERWVDHA
jgi:hypothetical protein